MANAFRGVNAPEQAGKCSRLFFGWVKPVLNHAKKYQVSVDEMGEVRPEDDVREQKSRLEEKWAYYKTRADKQNKLYWAVIKAYGWEFGVAIFWNLIIATFQLSSPFLLKRLIEFIKNEESDTVFGIILVLILGATQAAAYMVTEHVVYYTRMTGSKATNALSAMIFEKSLLVS